MKKIFTLLIALLSAISLHAYDFYAGGIYYNITSGHTVEVTSGENKYAGNIVIPEEVTYNNSPYSVISIGEEAFSRCPALTSVEIGNSVTEIGSDAFSNCSGLTKVEITSLEAWCKITFSNYLSNPLSLARHLYLNGGEVKDLIIPNSVTSIKDYAFVYCDALTNVVIPNSVTSIGEYAIYGCSALTNVEIGNSVTSIGAWAFGYCSGLKSIEIPNSVTSIGDSAFYECSGLTSVEIPDSVTEIGSGAFYGCTSLTKVEISSLEAWYKIKFSSSEANPLYYAKHLYLNGVEVTDLVIPNSITEIGDYAFAGCSGLTSVTIPNSVTSIGAEAFSSCKGLTSVEIGNSVTSIGYAAFYKCTGLTSVEIPNSVTSIGTSAFSNCTGLTSVTIPNSVTTIGNSAFLNCTGLTSVSIPNSVTEIEAGAFYYCTGLTNVVIPNSVTEIGSAAFYGCSGLTSVEIGNSVNEIGSSAFYGCAELKSLIFKSLQVLTLGSKAFNNCGNLATIQCDTNRPPVSSDYSVFDEEVYSNCKLYVPDAQKSLYYTVIPWSKFQNIYSTDYIPGEEENVYKIVPVLSLSQTLTLGVKNTETNSLEDTFQWNSSDVYVAEVDSQGVVTAKSVGDAIISATNSDGESATFEIIVTDGDYDTDVSEILLESEGNRNVYTLGGLIVIREATQEDLRTLAPGLYIIGGKKVLVK